MTPTVLHALCDELVKLATVKGPVKMYRRAYQSLVDGKHNFHGTTPTALSSILADGVLTPGKGTYGTGVYMWKDRPELTYMREPNSVGLVLNRGSYAAPTDASISTAIRRQMDISKDPVAIKGSTLSAPPDVLREVQDLTKNNRMRTIDSAIFHRAEGDVRMGQVSSPDVKIPSKKELVDLYQRKTEPKTIRKLRGKRTEAEEDMFIDSYLDATGQ